jgi:hypothetical protein
VGHDQFAQGKGGEAQEKLDSLREASGEEIDKAKANVSEFFDQVADAFGPRGQETHPPLSRSAGERMEQVRGAPSATGAAATAAPAPPHLDGRVLA